MPRPREWRPRPSAISSGVARRDNRQERAREVLQDKQKEPGEEEAAAKTPRRRRDLNRSTDPVRRAGDSGREN